MLIKTADGRWIERELVTESEKLQKRHIAELEAINKNLKTIMDHLKKMNTVYAEGWDKLAKAIRETR